MPPAPKVDVSGPGRWCKIHKVKRHHTKDCYHLKKEIEHLIQEGRLEKYVKDEPSQRTGRDSSHRRDDTKSLRSKKGKDLCKEYGKKIVCHTLNTIA